MPPASSTCRRHFLFSRGSWRASAQGGVELWKNPNGLSKRANRLAIKIFRRKIGLHGMLGARAEVAG